MKERFLILENNEKDAILNVEELKKEYDFEYLITSSESQFINAITEFEPTMILADYNLQNYSGLKALKAVQKKNAEIPFIIITGYLEEEQAVECLKEGAWNYVMKNNLVRLNPVVKYCIKLRQQYEEKKKLNENFSVIFENSLDVIFLLNVKNGRIAKVNKTVKRILGYQPHELIEKNFSYIFAREENFHRQQMIQKINVFNSVFDMQKFRKADGSICSMELTANIISWKNEDVIYVTLRDVSEREEMQKTLSATEQSFENIFDFAIDAIYVQDENERFISVNKGAEFMYGFSKNELIGKTPSSIAAPGKNDLQQLSSAFAKALQGTPQQFEFWGKRKNGEIFPKIVRLARGKYHGRNVVYAFALDISKQYRAVQKLNERNEMYRSIIENSHDGILLTGDDFRITFANDQLCHIVNYSKEELIGSDFRTYIADHHKKIVQDRYIRRRKGEAIISNYEIDLTNKFGETKNIQITASVIELNEKKITLAEILDITEKKQSEKQRKIAIQKLQEREEFNFALFEYNPIETLIVDNEGRILKTNRILREKRSRIPKIGSVMYKDYAAAHQVNMYEKMITCINTKKTITVEKAPYKNKILNITIAPFPKGAIIASHDITDKITAEKQIKKMNSVFEELSSDPIKNIDFIIQKINEILKGKYTFYRKLNDQDEIDISANSSFELKLDQSELKKFCTKILKQKYQKPIVAHFSNKSDKNEQIVYSFIGFPIFQQKKLVGALYLIDTKEREFTPNEQYIISTLAKAISIEEERNFTLQKVKTAFQERGLLLKEIHHRVNNNLQILISLLRMQKNFTKDMIAKSILNDSIFRVRTMSMVHEKLYQNKNLMEINFKDYLLSLISNIYIKTKIPTERVKVDYQVNDIKMNIDLAIPCGLILYELISNAFLHAFPEERKGNVKISIQKEKNIFTLIVQDDGIGLDEKIDFDSNNSIGFYLTNMMTSQLDGICEIKRDHGTIYQIRFPE